MDFISHGLWGGIALGRSSRKSFWLAFLFGIAPDLLSFGFAFLGAFVGHGLEFWRGIGHPPDPAKIPACVYQLYNVTHSLVVFGLAFAAVWVVRGRPLWEMGAWGLHVVVDIFTHTTAFFPTPFLWPLLSVQFNGWAWSGPVIFVPNVVLLVVLYAVFLWKHRGWPKGLNEHEKRNSGG